MFFFFFEKTISQVGGCRKLACNISINSLVIVYSMIRP